jgi:hypothetical protein
LTGLISKLSATGLAATYMAVAAIVKRVVNFIMSIVSDVKRLEEVEKKTQFKAGGNQHIY